MLRPHSSSIVVLLDYHLRNTYIFYSRCLLWTLMHICSVWLAFLIAYVWNLENQCLCVALAEHALCFLSSSNGTLPWFLFLYRSVRMARAKGVYACEQGHVHQRHFTRHVENLKWVSSKSCGIVMVHKHCATQVIYDHSFILNVWGCDCTLRVMYASSPEIF
jgi:hypothetical protein